MLFFFDTYGFKQSLGKTINLKHTNINNNPIIDEKN